MGRKYVCADEIFMRTAIVDEHVACSVRHLLNTLGLAHIHPCIAYMKRSSICFFLYCIIFNGCEMVGTPIQTRNVRVTILSAYQYRHMQPMARTLRSIYILYTLHTLDTTIYALSIFNAFKSPYSYSTFDK